MKCPIFTRPLLKLLCVTFTTAPASTPGSAFPGSPGEWNSILGPEHKRAAEIASADAPPLSIRHSRGQISIEWPFTASEWVLEQSSKFNLVIPWTPVPAALFQINATNNSMVISALAGNIFYRLRKLFPVDVVPGLTGIWSLDEGQGQTAQNSSGLQNSATFTNAKWTTGRMGASALWFNGGASGIDGSRAWMSNANYSLLPPTCGAFSVALWFKPDASSNGWSGLIGDDANGSNGWHLALHSPGRGTNELVLASTGLGTSLSVTARTLLLPGRWHELAATYDGNEGMIYLDSELLARGPGALQGNTDPICFGGGVGGYDSFVGSIDEVRTFTNALAQEDISLAAQWHLDENRGIFARDSSIHGHHAAVSAPGAWVSGKDGSGIDLSSNTVTMPNDYSEVLPPTGGSFSVSFWLSPNSIVESWSGLMSNADGTNTGWNLALFAEGPGQTWLHFASTNSGGTMALYAPIDLVEGVWSKLDLTYNGGIATFYLDGRKVQSDSGGIQGSTAPLIIGAVPGMANFNGMIDEMKIYSRERGEAEIGPVAKVMWETVLLNTSSNLILQGFGPAGKPLTYSIVNTLSPTNGTVMIAPGSAIATYAAGATKGPDAFAYSVSDGEFTTPPTIVVVSVVEPHWLSPDGGLAAPQDGSSPDHAWAAGAPEALDAIWKTNNYYDCFFYAPGEYQTTGAKWGERRTANSGCKHIGSGSEGTHQTVLKLVNQWDAWKEELIFADWAVGAYCDGFEVRGLVLDCNAAENPKYRRGEPVWIKVPLVATGRVDTVTLHWDESPFLGVWRFGSAQDFTICTRLAGTSDYVTNCSGFGSTDRVDTVSVDADSDEIILRLEQRSPRVDFYSLNEIEVTGTAAVSLPSATIPGGAESRLRAANANFSILQGVDGNFGSAWASGPEDQVRIVLPLGPGTAVSQLDLYWNCHAIAGVGRLGPAAQYRIQARNPTTQEFEDVSFLPQSRSATGLQRNRFGRAAITDQLVILLTARELGVDFFSLKEIMLYNGNEPVPLKIPTAMNTLGWGNFPILSAFDGDPATQWASDTQGMVGAIDVVGNNLKFTDLRVVGFGTKATRECFPLAVRTPPGWAPTAHFGNVLVQDCVFTDPATNNTDGLTAVVVVGVTPHTLTNAVVRGCTVADVKSHFRYSHGFSATQVEQCLVAGCGEAVYFEPAPGVVESVGAVLIRSNLFLNVNNGVYLGFAPGARFDTLTCTGNETVLDGAGGWCVAGCDTCGGGPSGWLTNVTALNNLVRYGDWSLRPGSDDGGLYCSDIHNAVFGNNVIVLGTASGLRLRGCPSGLIPPPGEIETCDTVGPVTPPNSGPVYSACLDVLPIGYRRAWFNNRDLQGSNLKVSFWQTGSDGFASQQQWK